MRLKKMVGFLVSACFLASTTCMTAFAANDSGAPEIRVYDKNDAVVATFNYYYDGINGNDEPQYTVEMDAVGETAIKKTKLQTKAQGLSTWASNTETHNSYFASNSITYSYTSNPPSNPYVYAKADITIEDGTVYRIPQHKLTNAQ